MIIRFGVELLTRLLGNIHQAFLESGGVPCPTWTQYPFTPLPAILPCQPPLPEGLLNGAYVGKGCQAYTIDKKRNQHFISLGRVPIWSKFFMNVV